MEIQTPLTGAMTALWTKVLIFLPDLVLGLVIVVVGYVVARMAQRVSAAIAARAGIDRASDDSGVRRLLNASGVEIGLSGIIGRTVFLFVLLLFVITAVESVGLESVSGTIDSFILFLPKVFAALIIATLGLFLAQIVRDAVLRATDRFGVESAGALSALSYGVITLVVATLAISQLDVDTRLLHLLIGIVLAVAGVAIALSLGFGTRRIATDIVYGIYARDDIQVGDNIEVGGAKGEVVEVGTVMTIIVLADGRHRHIPNTRLMTHSFDLLPADDV